MENVRHRNPGLTGGWRCDELQGPQTLHSHQHHVAMHELSIAMSIVDVARELLTLHSGDRIRTVYIQVGPLAGVAKEALQFSFPMACEGTQAEGSALVIEDGQGGQ